jgi:outer membrane protein assembly factor BamB
MIKRRIQQAILSALMLVLIPLSSCIGIDAVSERKPKREAPAKDWFASVAPSEHGDSARTHLFRRINAPAARDFEKASSSTRLIAPDLPGLYNSVVDNDGKVFVLGGIGAFGNGAYVASLDAWSLEKSWQTPLPGAATPGEWNYPGVVGLHADGFLYAIYGYRLARLDRASGKMLAVLELPTPQERKDVAYNGFTVLNDGMIAAKSYHRKPGCTEDGFRAVMICGLSGTKPSVLALIDPATMTVISTTIAPELIGGRISSTQFDGADYVYAPGVDRLFRFRYADGALTFDEDWQPAPYRTGQQTPGTAATFLGDFAIIQTNAIATGAPLTLTAISQTDADRVHAIVPFPNATRSMIPSMPSVDPDSGMVYVVDGLARSIAGLKFDQDTGFKTAWRDQQMSFGFSALIGPAESRVLISSHALDATSFTDGTEDEIVWRDAATGRVLARSEPVGRIGGAVLGVNENGIVYVPAPRENSLAAVKIQP